MFEASNSIKLQHTDINTDKQYKVGASLVKLLCIIQALGKFTTTPSINYYKPKPCIHIYTCA